MSDTIYRQDAIDAHCELCPDQYICCPVRNGNICPDFEVFRLLQSAQPERKRGKWCITPDGKLVCSNCYENPTNRIIIDGELVYDMTPIKGKMKYCPNCGADMMGGDAE